MKTSLLGVVLLSALALAQIPAARDVEGELSKLKGTWNLVSEIDDGKELSAEEARRIKLIFEGDGKWKVEVDGKMVGEGTTLLNPTSRPKTLDYTFTGGEQKGTRFLAVYELDGGTFRHCGAVKGDRPTEFASKPGSGHSLTTFRRDRKE
jgi:uncharacterized protein (TIGR03067 family)